MESKIPQSTSPPQPEPLQFPVQPDASVSKLKQFFTKKKNFVIASGVLVVLILAILLFIFANSSKEKSNTGSNIIAKVDGQPIYQAYVNRELEFYPGKKTQETESLLKEKVISDEIVLQGAKKEGLVSDYPSSETLSSADYLKRTDEVKKIKEMIENKADGISGEIVSIWFYNNDYIGPLGLEKGKQIANEKITALYNRVKNKEITVKQAGELVASDKSLTQIDPVYGPNAYVAFKTGESPNITFWQEFDNLLWKLKPGELTPVYLGTDEKDGKTVEQLYLFGQVNERIENKGYKSFEQWYGEKQKEFEIGYQFKLFGLDLAYAKKSNAGPGGCGHGCPPWEGYVVTQTGAPILGAIVTQKNCQAPEAGDECNQVATRNVTTDEKGYYYFIDALPFDCGHDSHSFSVSIPNGECDNLKRNIGNIVSLQTLPNIICRITTPPPVCGDVCTTPADCQGIKDGCTQCVPKPDGSGNICQPPPPPACNAFCSSDNDCTLNNQGCTQCVAGQCRIPPACNVACTKDGQCVGARDGCTACVGGVCKVPPACNVTCTTPADCQGAKDGCTACLPNDAGTGNVCRPTPACNVACTKDGQCAGAKDGCTACVGGVCKIPPSCGTACTTRAECSGVKDGCSECLEGTCTDYNDNMCKCDGMVADMVYPSDSFNFEAFGKVEGTDVKKAEIADVTFRLTKDNEVVARSNPITPTVVESSANKLRVKAAWSTPPPPVSKGSTYRVFADVRCKPKKIVASAKENFTPNFQTAQLKPPPGLKLLADTINNLAGNSNDRVKTFTSKLLSMFGASTVKAQTSNLQLQTLNFVKVLDTDNCRFVMFKFDETLF